MKKFGDGLDSTSSTLSSRSNFYVPSEVASYISQLNDVCDSQTSRYGVSLTPSQKKSRVFSVLIDVFEKLAKFADVSKVGGQLLADLCAFEKYFEVLLVAFHRDDCKLLTLDDCRALFVYSYELLDTNEMTKLVPGPATFSTLALKAFSRDDVRIAHGVLATAASAGMPLVPEYFRQLSPLGRELLQTKVFGTHTSLPTDPENVARLRSLLTNSLPAMIREDLRVTLSDCLLNLRAHERAVSQQELESVDRRFGNYPNLAVHLDVLRTLMLQTQPKSNAWATMHKVTSLGLLAAEYGLVESHTSQIYAMMNSTMRSFEAFFSRRTESSAAPSRRRMRFGQAPKLDTMTDGGARSAGDGDRVMNEAKRDVRRETQIWAPFIDQVICALNKLKKSRELSSTAASLVDVYRGVRGVRFPEDGAYSVSGVFCWPAFSSSSRSRAVADTFAGAGSSSIGTLFIMSIYDAVDISKFSKFPEEDEVLIPPNSYFIVEKRTSKEQELLSRSVPIVTCRELNLELVDEELGNFPTARNFWVKHFGEAATVALDDFESALYKFLPEIGQKSMEVLRYASERCSRGETSYYSMFFDAFLDTSAQLKGASLHKPAEEEDVEESSQNSNSVSLASFRAFLSSAKMSAEALKKCSSFCESSNIPAPVGITTVSDYQKWMQNNLSLIPWEMLQQFSGLVTEFMDSILRLLCSLLHIYECDLPVTTADPVGIVNGYGRANGSWYLMEAFGFRVGMHADPVDLVRLLTGDIHFKETEVPLILHKLHRTSLAWQPTNGEFVIPALPKGFYKSKSKNSSQYPTQSFILAARLPLLKRTGSLMPTGGGADVVITSARRCARQSHPGFGSLLEEISSQGQTSVCIPLMMRSITSDSSCFFLSSPDSMLHQGVVWVLVVGFLTTGLETDYATFRKSTGNLLLSAACVPLEEMQRVDSTLGSINPAKIRDCWGRTIPVHESQSWRPMLWKMEATAWHSTPLNYPYWSHLISRNSRTHATAGDLLRMMQLTVRDPDSSSLSSRAKLNRTNSDANFVIHVAPSAKVSPEQDSAAVILSDATSRLRGIEDRDLVPTASADQTDHHADWKLKPFVEQIPASALNVSDVIPIHWMIIASSSYSSNTRLWVFTIVLAAVTNLMLFIVCRVSMFGVENSSDCAAEGIMAFVVLVFFIQGVALQLSVGKARKMLQENRTRMHLTSSMNIIYVLSLNAIMLLIVCIVIQYVELIVEPLQLLTGEDLIYKYQIVASTFLLVFCLYTAMLPSVVFAIGVHSIILGICDESGFYAPSGKIQTKKDVEETDIASIRRICNVHGLLTEAQASVMSITAFYTYAMPLLLLYTFCVLFMPLGGGGGLFSSPKYMSDASLPMNMVYFYVPASYYLSVQFSISRFNSVDHQIQSSFRGNILKSLQKKDLQGANLIIRSSKLSQVMPGKSGTDPVGTKTKFSMNLFYLFLSFTLILPVLTLVNPGIYSERHDELCLRQPHRQVTNSNGVFLTLDNSTGLYNATPWYPYDSKKGSAIFSPGYDANETDWISVALFVVGTEKWTPSAFAVVYPTTCQFYTAPTLHVYHRSAVFKVRQSLNLDGFVRLSPYNSCVVQINTRHEIFTNLANPTTLDTDDVTVKKLSRDIFWMTLSISYLFTPLMRDFEDTGDINTGSSCTPFALRFPR